MQAGRTAGRGRIGAALAALALALALSAPLPARAQSSPASLVADRVVIDGRGRLVASGAVEVWHGSVRLTARQVIYDQAAGTLSVEGPLTLSDGPERIVVADAADLSSDLRAGLMTSARMVLHQQLQLTANRIERRDGLVTQLDAVIASSCQVCASDPTPLWEIRAARVTHDQAASTLRFDQAQFRLRGVPVVAVPHLTLPDGSVDRLRGLLVPQVQVSSDLGARVSVPYFIPFGDDRDLTLTPQITDRGGLSLGFRWRQVFARGGIELGGQISRDRILPGQLRGYGYVRALFALGGGWRLTADAIAPSDRPYLETYGVTDASRLASHVTVERVRRDEWARARVMAFRSLRPLDDNDVLPNRVVQGDWERRWGSLPIGGELTLAARLHAHARTSTLDGVAGRDVARGMLRARWQRREVLAGGVLATVALQGRIDNVRIADDLAYPDPVTRSALEGMIEFRWPLARVDAGGGQQLLEPVVQLIGARRRLGALPNDDHLMPELDEGSLFAPIRHTGLDAPDDGTRANAGLRWMRYAPEGWSVETAVGRVWRREALAGFAPGHRQPLGSTESDWLLAGRLASAGGLSVGLRVLINDARDISRGEASLTWDRGAGAAITSRYLYVSANTAESRPNPLNEWTLDLTHRFASGWSGRVGWDYDIGTGEWGAARTGLEFRNECLAVDLSLSRRFATSTNLTASTRFGLRVELLGLTGRSIGPQGRSCRA